jgi:hypothetical protein
MAVDQLLRARWALQRAEARLAAGRYGRSVRSGQPIPTSGCRPTPGRTDLEEATAADGGAVDESDGAAGLVSAGHP